MLFVMSSEKTGLKLGEDPRSCCDFEMSKKLNGWMIQGAFLSTRDETTDNERERGDNMIEFAKRFLVEFHKDCITTGCKTRQQCLEAIEGEWGVLEGTLTGKKTKMKEEISDDETGHKQTRRSIISIVRDMLKHKAA